MRRALVLAAAVFVLWRLSRTARPARFRPERAPFVGDHALSVVLPVTPHTLASLDDLLAPFLVTTSTIYEVAIVYPYSLASDITRRLPDVVSDAPLGHPKVSLYPWAGSMHHHQASLQLIARMKTPYVLLLDEHGLDQISECDRAYLLRPRAVELPVGPRGFTGSSQAWFPLPPSDRAQPAAFLAPPFVTPSRLLANPPFTFRSSSDWPALGDYIAESTLGSFGGIVIGTNILGTTACNPGTRSNASLTSQESTDNPGAHSDLAASLRGFLVLAFPSKEDLADFSPATCKLRRQGYAVLAYIYDAEFSDAVIGRNCTIPYFERYKESLGFSDWLESIGFVPDIVIGLDHQDSVSSSFSLILERPPFLNTTLIRLPRTELPYTEWIGTLTLHELRHWNVPEVTLSVITNDRPRSLQRLFDSMQRTLFYGDKVNLRINMDQTSNPETTRIVQDFEWFHGDVFLHHRVIRGGLLAAVAESWFPHCNDSYGLLLEDDIELSPLSYAWVKMALLRYKYGDLSSSSKLFGISLYQQKMIELRPTGRQPFSARALFQSASLADPSTPYLSQIPCSWGALYFPSPWLEFHDYLSFRLSERAFPIHTTVVPGVRSNKWTRSWKKYFIELVYLRGYVMLYPNYADFVSLSTNHLEVGSHVTHDPETVYEGKKQLFSLPLMRVSGALAQAGEPKSESKSDGDDGGGGAASSPRLLDFPGGALPDWDRLPVLDLVGILSSMEVIQKKGDRRRSEFGVCSNAASLSSRVRDLLCPAPH